MTRPRTALPVAIRTTTPTFVGLVARRAARAVVERFEADPLIYYMWVGLMTTVLVTLVLAL